MRSLFALLIMVATSFLTSGCFIFNIPLDVPPPNYQEIIMEQGRSRQKILLLDIDGTITSGTEESGGFLSAGSSSTVNEVAEKLALAREDHSIRAIILRVDSPGGGVTASDVVYRMLREYRTETGIPVYASMLDLAASGGYYISMAADEIYAHPTSITGSIGVIAMFPQLEGLGQKIGVSVETVKSGDMKDMGSPFHDMTPQQREVFQVLIDEMYDRFVEVVKEGRPQLSETEIRQLADGRVYTARQATDKKLIDGVMYLDEVIDHVRLKEGLSSDSRVIMYRRSNRGSYESLYARATPIHDAATSPMGQTTTNIGLINVDAGGLVGLPAPRLYYLWAP